MSDLQTLLEAYFEAHQADMTQQLRELIRIPSISQLKDHWPDTQRVLEKMSDLVSAYGFKPEIIQTPGCPAFIATLEVAPERPWLIVYNHMDVQPANEPQWQSEPFEPRIENGRIIGRGSTDDKGPALTILHAIHCLHQAGLPLPNIQLVYETEEESGSTHFGWFLDHAREKLQNPASILVSDTIFEGDHPAITYRLRGLLRAEVCLQTGTQDAHSGMVGGAVSNPLNILIQALSKCVDAQGNVTIPGVLEDLTDLTDVEKEKLAITSSIFDVEKFLNDNGNPVLYTDDACELLQRIWMRPTFEVHGFEGVQTAPGSIKTALPYAVKAKVTMRLVAGQDPQRVAQQLESCLKSVHPQIELNYQNGTRACMTSLENVFIQQAIAACESGFGQTPVFVGGGGTIGALPEFERVFPDAPLVLIAQSLMSDGYHAPNENFQLKQLHDGFITMAHYLSRIADVHTVA